MRWKFVGSPCSVHMISQINNFLSFSFWKKSKDLNYHVNAKKVLGWSKKLCVCLFGVKFIVTNLYIVCKNKNKHYTDSCWVKIYCSWAVWTVPVNSTSVILAPIKIKKKKKKTGKTYTNLCFTYTLHVRIHVGCFTWQKCYLCTKRELQFSCKYIYIYLFLLDKNNSPASKVRKKYRACQIVHIEL